MDKNDSVHFVTVLEVRMNENEEKNVGKVADLDALEAGSRSRSASVGYCESASDDFVQDWVEGLLMLPWIGKSSSQCRGINPVLSISFATHSCSHSSWGRVLFKLSNIFFSSAVHVFLPHQLTRTPKTCSAISLNTNMKYSE